MIDRVFSEITANDINSLVTNRVSESRTLDYKQAIEIITNDEKKELLRDVTSFANSSGGDLLFGIAEERDTAQKPTGIPESICGITQTNVDDLKLRIEQLIRTGCEPKVPSIQMREFTVDSKTVLLIRVGDSWQKPHRVSLQSSPQFYMRNSAGKVPFDYQDLRDAFVQSTEVAKRMREFRDNRLSRVLSGDLLMPMASEYFLCMYFLPIESFRQERVIDLERYYNGYLQLPQSIGINGYSRPNIDGVLQLQTGAQIGPPAYGFTQLFHNGALELIDSYSIHKVSEQNDAISSREVERSLRRGISEAFTCLIRHQTQSDVYLHLAMLNVGGLKLYEQDRFGVAIPKRVDRNHLIFSDIKCDLSIGPACYLKMCCDMFWQAFGVQQSPNFDESGEWEDPSR